MVSKTTSCIFLVYYLFHTTYYMFLLYFIYILNMCFYFSHLTCTFHFNCCLNKIFVIVIVIVIVTVRVKYSTCTWYLYLNTYLSVLDVLEYLVYRNVKVLVLVLDQKVLGTSQVVFKYYFLKSVKIANYFNTLL